MSKHVVTQPREPFRSGDGTVEVHQVPVSKDNLAWIVVCTKTGEAAVVDSPEAEPVLSYCRDRSMDLRVILNTHTHSDHVGINSDLERMGLLGGMRVVGPKRAASAVPGITEPVDEGDTVTLGAATARVLLTEGHLNGHISFVFDDVLFCGDTLFAAGCGYLFDGPPAKMYDSLMRLSKLRDSTRVCCAHEYTQDNLRFAWSVEPDNDALKERIRQAWRTRAGGGCTVPSLLGEERATNPFLRQDSPTLRRIVEESMPGRALSSNLEVFAATRALKDRKDYRRIPDNELPIA